MIPGVFNLSIPRVKPHSENLLIGTPVVLSGERVAAVTTGTARYSAGSIWTAQFIIFDTQFLVFNAQFLVFDTQLLVLNAQFIIFYSRQPPTPMGKLASVRHLALAGVRLKA